MTTQNLHGLLIPVKKYVCQDRGNVSDETLSASDPLNPWVAKGKFSGVAKTSHYSSCVVPGGPRQFLCRRLFNMTCDLLRLTLVKLPSPLPPPQPKSGHEGGYMSAAAAARRVLENRVGLSQVLEKGVLLDIEHAAKTKM